MKAQHHNFTLIELLLAITIMVTVLAIISLSFRSVVSAWQGMARSGGEVEKVMMVSNFADEIIRNIVPMQWRRPSTNSEELIFRGGDSSLIGCARRRGNSETVNGIIYFEIYFAGNTVWLYTDSRPFFSEDEDDAELVQRRMGSRILMEKVKSFTIKYGFYSNNKIDWVEEWLPATYANALPAAILINAEWEDGRKEAWLRRLNGVSGSSSVPTMGGWQ